MDQAYDKRKLGDPSEAIVRPVVPVYLINHFSNDLVSCSDRLFTRYTSRSQTKEDIYLSGEVNTFGIVFVAFVFNLWCSVIAPTIFGGFFQDKPRFLNRL